MIGGALSRETQLFMSTVLAPIIQGESIPHWRLVADNRLWTYRDVWNDEYQHAGLQKAWNSRRVGPFHGMQAPG